MIVRLVALLACVVALNLGCRAEESGSGAPEAQERAAESGAEGGSAAADDAGDTTVVARIGSEEITLKEVDDWIKNDLFERQMSSPAAAFEARSEALDNMVKIRVIEGKAAERNMTGEEFVMAEVAARGEISKEEIEKFYNDEIEKMGGQTLEQASPHIESYLMQLRMHEIVDHLLEEAGVAILFETPLVEVAATGPSKGPEDAAVTIIEFSDFQCPFCSRALPIVSEVLARNPDVRMVYRHLPLDRIHPRARPAAAAAICAEAQGQFWPYHDLLFANAQALSDDDLAKYAGEVGLDVDAWTACLADPATNARIDEDVAAANAVGITGTPAFVIDGLVLSGARPAKEFVSAIEKARTRKAGGDAS